MALGIANDGDLVSDNTLFISSILNGYRDNVPDAFYAKWANTFNCDSRYNIKANLVEVVALDDTATRTLVIPGVVAVADWQLVYLRVFGQAKLTITAKDTNGVTTITGIVRAYGNSILPGIIALSDYNISAGGLVVTAEADDTIIEVFHGICESD